MFFKYLLTFIFHVLIAKETTLNFKNSYFSLIIRLLCLDDNEMKRRMKDKQIIDYIYEQLKIIKISETEKSIVE